MIHGICLKMLTGDCTHRSHIHSMEKLLAAIPASGRSIGTPAFLYHWLPESFFLSQYFNLFRVSVKKIQPKFLPLLIPHNNGPLWSPLQSAASGSFQTYKIEESRAFSKI